MNSVVTRGMSVIMNIFSKLKREDKKNKELVKADSISLLEKETNKELLRVVQDNNFDKNKLTKIGDATKVNMILQQLPLAANTVQSEELKGAYKVVFPEGVSGTLMKYNI